QALRLIQDIENGLIDTVKVKHIDRLGRNLINILQTLQFFSDKKINVKVIDLAIESRLVNGKPNPIFPLIVNILSVISEQEKLNISERTRQGILLAQLQGKFAGRKKGTTESDEEFLNKYKNEIK